MRWHRAEPSLPERYRALIARHAPGRTFADIGCMWNVHGAYALHALDVGATDVVGVDLMPASPEFLAENRARGDRVRFIQGDVNEPAVAEAIGAVSTVFCSGVLYHVPNPIQTLVWAPGRVTPGRHASPVRGLDVAPTALRLAGLPVPSAMQGRDVFAAAAPAEPVVAEASWGSQIMVLDPPWKLVRTLESFFYVDRFAHEAGDTELYDLATDPGEQASVLGQHADIAARLTAHLDSWRSAHVHTNAEPTSPPPTLSPERKRDLRALGYVE